MTVTKAQFIATLEEQGCEWPPMVFDGHIYVKCENGELVRCEI